MLDCWKPIIITFLFPSSQVRERISRQKTTPVNYILVRCAFSHQPGLMSPFLSALGLQVSKSLSNQVCNRHFDETLLEPPCPTFQPSACAFIPNQTGLNRLYLWFWIKNIIIWQIYINLFTKSSLSFLNLIIFENFDSFFFKPLTNCAKRANLFLWNARCYSTQYTWSLARPSLAALPDPLSSFPECTRGWTRSAHTHTSKWRTEKISSSTGITCEWVGVDVTLHFGEHTEY